jgi:hypothetical protein
MSRDNQDRDSRNAAEPCEQDSAQGEIDQYQCDILRHCLIVVVFPEVILLSRCAHRTLRPADPVAAGEHALTTILLQARRFRRKRGGEDVQADWRRSLCRPEAPDMRSLSRSVDQEGILGCCWSIVSVSP